MEICTAPDAKYKVTGDRDGATCAEFGQYVIDTLATLHKKGNAQALPFLNAIEKIIYFTSGRLYNICIRNRKTGAL